MRIIAGSAKGRHLRSLRGRALRPTAERVRESVFAVLGPRVPDARFLDLYAGAGTMGLEALSRGAAHATFVESHRPAGRVIEENARRCGIEDRTRVIIAPVARGLAKLRREAAGLRLPGQGLRSASPHPDRSGGAVFDLVFLDPPYDQGEVGAAMARLAQWPEMVSERGLVICQHSRHEEVQAEIGAFVRMRSMRFGETLVDFYEPLGQRMKGL